jgi:hypothetical protein
MVYMFVCTADGNNDRLLVRARDDTYSKFGISVKYSELYKHEGD